MQTIGPILEIRSVQYPKVGKANPKVGIGIVVPAMNPEAGARLVVVNISSGTTKFANLITDREVVKSAQVLCHTVRWAMSCGYDRCDDVLYQVGIDAQLWPICVPHAEIGDRIPMRLIFRFTKCDTTTPSSSQLAERKAAASAAASRC